jgi:hypothetical protein
VRPAVRDVRPLCQDHVVPSASPVAAVRSVRPVVRDAIPPGEAASAQDARRRRRVPSEPPESPEAEVSNVQPAVLCVVRLALPEGAPWKAQDGPLVGQRVLRATAVAARPLVRGAQRAAAVQAVPTVDCRPEASGALSLAQVVLRVVVAQEAPEAVKAPRLAPAARRAAAAQAALALEMDRRPVVPQLARAVLPGVVVPAAPMKEHRPEAAVALSLAQAVRRVAVGRAGRSAVRRWAEQFRRAVCQPGFQHVPDDCPRLAWMSLAQAVAARLARH